MPDGRVLGGKDRVGERWAGAVLSTLDSGLAIPPRGSTIAAIRVRTPTATHRSARTAHPDPIVALLFGKVPSAVTPVWSGVEPSAITLGGGLSFELWLGGVAASSWDRAYGPTLGGRSRPESPVAVAPANGQVSAAISRFTWLETSARQTTGGLSQTRLVAILRFDLSVAHCDQGHTQPTDGQREMANAVIGPSHRFHPARSKRSMFAPGITLSQVRTPRRRCGQFRRTFPPCK